MTQWFAKYTGTLAGMVKTAVCLDTGWELHSYGLPGV